MPSQRILLKLLSKKLPKKITYRQMIDGPKLPKVLSERGKLNGIQKGLDKKPIFYLYTDKASESTFSVPIKENLELGIVKELQKLDLRFPRR